jgi:hydroxymethylglutaryl-CoA lyase
LERLGLKRQDSKTSTNLLEDETAMKLPESVILRDVVVRDGFQNEEFFVPTDTKLYFIDQLGSIGFKYIEVTSFVHPKYVPQFRDAEDVLQRLPRDRGIIYSVLTLNERALERVFRCMENGYGPDMVGFAIATSDTYNQRNVGRTSAELWDEAERITRRAKEAGLKVVGTVGTTFGSPFEGTVPIDVPIEYTARLVDMGVDEVNYGDTTGEGTPDRVFELFSRICDEYTDVALVAHFHETRGWGLANCLAAMQAGINRFDVSMGGLGGQPATVVDRVPVRGTGPKYVQTEYTGNVRGEDLAVMLENMGIRTGLDVEQYLDLGRMLEKIVGRELRSYCTKLGQAALTRRRELG